VEMQILVPSINTFLIDEMKRCLLFSLLIFSCSAPTRQDVLLERSLSPTIEVTLFPSEYSGFGYDISVDGKLFVHQPNVPAMAGSKGFPTEQSAQRVANLVIQKIRGNQIPPTLTVAEVMKLLPNSSD
jgi:hypothetical protein